jgi:hypothetical protein
MARLCNQRSGWVNVEVRPVASVAGVAGPQEARRKDKQEVKRSGEKTP